MIDKTCIFLTNQSRKEMPEIDDEKAEVKLYINNACWGSIARTARGDVDKAYPQYAKTTEKA